MYYLYTVWSGCPHEIFSMVSLSNYTLCILFFGPSHSINTSWMNSTQNWPPFPNYSSILLREKQVNSPSDFIRKNFTMQNTLNLVTITLGRFNIRLIMYLTLSHRVCYWTQGPHRRLLLLKMNSKEIYISICIYYGKLFCIRILHFTSRFLQGSALFPP